ncbi:AfsR/SARP family transcriptional regulator, partial [Streptomyces rubiginosohelvolus]
MDIEVLGGFAARLGRTRIVPTAPKPRQVLALLALNAGRLVPAALLVEELWGAHPPRSARTHHIDEEERTILNGARANVPDARRVELGAVFLRDREKHL